MAVDQNTQIGAAVAFFVFLVFLFFGGIWFLLLLVVVAAGAVGLRVHQLKQVAGGGSPGESSSSGWSREEKKGF